MDNDVVAARELRWSYRHGKSRNLVVDQVSLTINRGDVVVLAGPNGSGKSTLLRMLGGSIQPDNGTVRVFGKPPHEARIGIVWQETYVSLYPWLTALDNAALPLRLQKVRRPERQRRIRMICDELGFDVPLDRHPFELSGGEQQKVCILRALASECELLLLDEPTANLSFESGIDLLMHLQRIQIHTNLTTVIVSHSPEFSVFVADAVIPLRSKPLRLCEKDRTVIHCQHRRPRPMTWMYENEFRDQVDSLKRNVGALK